MEFTSKFNIGDIVIFQPNLTNNSSYAGSVMAKIVAVKFTESKVFYDLALADRNNEEEGFYTACPLRDVDSYCVSK